MTRRWSWLGPLVLVAACGHHASRPEPPRRPVEPAPSATPEDRKPQRSRYQQERDSAPGARPDIANIPEPVPRAEPKSAYGNQSPYTVLGQTYKVLDSCKGYSERGIASWYGNKFHGHLTSNRESYDMYQFSAAHKTLPLPCYVRVTNLENGRSVVVRVNDRGPFFETRVIDLSYVAAIKLGIDGHGTGLVEVRALDPAHLEAAPPERVVAARKAALYLQVGAFADPDNARRLQARLGQEGIAKVGIDPVEREGRRLHRVRIGPLASVDEADALEARLKRMGVTSISVNVD